MFESLLNTPLRWSSSFHSFCYSRVDRDGVHSSKKFPWEDIFNLGFCNAPSEFCCWTQIKKDIWKQSTDLQDFQSLNDLKTYLFTAWKVSVFWIILVRIFPHSDWIRTKITPNAHSFYTVVYLNKISSINQASAEQHYKVGENVAPSVNLHISTTKITKIS